MAVPYTFGTATASIPLSNLDSNFATTITLGNTAIQLGNTVTTLNNMTLTTPKINTITSTAGNALTLQSNNGNTAVTVSTSQYVGIGNTNPAALLHVGPLNGSGSLNGYTKIAIESTDYAALTLKAPSANFSQIIFTDTTSSALGQILYLNSTNATPNAMTFYTNGVESMRIDSTQNLLVGTVGLDGRFRVEQSGVVWARATNHTNAGTQYFDSFRYNGTPIGSITGSNTLTTYATVSDYRLKENVVPMTGALSKIALLKPVTYKWKFDGSDGEGFIAHELGEVFPQAVIGAKDAVDEDGNPLHQGIDTSFLVATLTSAIQELTARVAALEAK